MIYFHGRGETKTVGGLKWVLQAFFTWATFEKRKENIDFQLKDTNVYITAEAVNFLTYGEQHEQHKHAPLRLIADINEQENVGFVPRKINHSGCFPLNEHLTTSCFDCGAWERRNKLLSLQKPLSQTLCHLHTLLFSNCERSRETRRSCQKDENLMLTARWTSSPFERRWAAPSDASLSSAH